MLGLGRDGRRLSVAGSWGWGQWGEGRSARASIIVNMMLLQKMHENKYHSKAVNSYARCGMEAEGAVAKIGNIENVKAWFHTREAERRMEAVRNFFSCSGEQFMLPPWDFHSRKGVGLGSR